MAADSSDQMTPSADHGRVDPGDAEVPSSFLGYLKSFGPGLIVVLTWLGAGDIVENGVAGGNYGYTLMWVVVVAVFMRFCFVSLLAKYQLFNQHGEGVLDGLGRLSPLYPPFLAVAAVVMGHIYGSYMTVGIGEVCANLVGFGETWMWAILWNGLALFICVRPIYKRVEWVFKVLLALLAVSFLSCAIWVRPDPGGIGGGLMTFGFPEQKGQFDSVLIAMGIIGAVGGSLMNLVYPYFLDDKGWRKPAHRRVQLYDFLLAMIVMVIINLSIWTLGAELLHPKGLTIEKIGDLPELLSQVIGEKGRVLFYLGVFAAVYTSIIGHALGLGRLGSHGILRWKTGVAPSREAYLQHRAYRWITVWCLVSPLVWTLPGMPGFVTLTLLANSAQVVLVPFIAGGLWWITASGKYIGKEHKNRWWENLIMGSLFVLAIWGAFKSVNAVAEKVQELLA
ncbi:MAG: Nramp family divalent metal transporter [Planctomycetes bacterium]|nr:Nramp family divalent metal transporter [Planctomycetota bacterium]